MTDSVEIQDIVIIGRGFAGLSLAVELAKSGTARIEIIYDDKDTLEASRAAHGISTIKGIFEADSQLFSKKIEGHSGFNSWLQQLEDLIGSKRPPDVWRLGVYESFSTPDDFRKDFGRIYRKDFLGAKNVSVDFSVKGPFAKAFYPADFWIDPQYLLDVLMAASKQLGVTITPDRVLKIRSADGYSELDLSSGRRKRARCSLICAGAGTAALIPEGGPNTMLPMFAVAGSSFKAACDLPESCEVKGTAGVISVGGRVHWGSTSEPARALGTESHLVERPTKNDRMFAAQKLLTKFGCQTLVETTIETNWGVRVRTRGRDPFVECIESRANIWVISGFYKSGITLCWLLSKAVANKILEAITASELLTTSSR
jgi:glycine/D-amino acid oxidase-like deaminating enzyme